MRVKTTIISICGLAFLLATAVASAQPQSARSVLEQSARAMGGLDRLRGIDSLIMTGFGQVMSQEGGGNPSPDPRSPVKWQAQNDVLRGFDLSNQRSIQSARTGFLFPFAITWGHDWTPETQVQTGAEALTHPLPALLAALDDSTSLGPVTTEGDDHVIEFTLDSGETLWLGIDNLTSLPDWVRWISPSGNLGEVSNTRYFTGYIPYDGIRLPIGLSTIIDWRDLNLSSFHVDGYEVNGELPPFPETASGGDDGADSITAVAIEVAEGVWDLRVGTNGGAVVEFEDHLLMFEVYGSEAASLARIDLANTLVPGKEVTHVIVSHHHFDHSGGVRAAVSRGLTLIAKRANEGILSEMTSRPAPNFPDALAQNPQPMKFIPVDDHLVLEDDTMRVDIYEVVGHPHMPEAVFAYIPEHEIVMQGDMFDINWDWHWWGGNYLDSMESYGLEPQTDIPVHGRVAAFDEVIANIEDQVEAAIAFCAQNESSGIVMAGCPVRYSRDL